MEAVGERGERGEAISREIQILQLLQMCKCTADKCEHVYDNVNNRHIGTAHFVH